MNFIEKMITKQEISPIMDHTFTLYCIKIPVFIGDLRERVSNPIRGKEDLVRAQTDRRHGSVLYQVRGRLRLGV